MVSDDRGEEIWIPTPEELAEQVDTASRTPTRPSVRRPLRGGMRLTPTALRSEEQPDAARPKRES